MITVALIGADGAGKTTICRRFAREQPQLFRYVYMGINIDASNLVLPTTRLLQNYKRAMGKASNMGGPPDPARIKPRPRGLVKRTARGLKSGLRLVNRLAEEWFRQLAAWSYQRKGFVVLFDRHFYADYYAHDIVGDNANRPFTGLVHGFVLGHLYPKPDLVILLDAPASILFDRKREGTLELVERRRQEYLQLRGKLEHFVVVDASQSQDEVARAVIEIIQEFYRSRSSRRLEVQDA